MIRIRKAFLKPHSVNAQTSVIGFTGELPRSLENSRLGSKVQSLEKKIPAFFHDAVDSVSTSSSFRRDPLVMTDSTRMYNALESTPTQVELRILNEILDDVSVSGLPNNMLLGSLRLAVLSRGRELSVERLIQSMELFSNLRISDHLFFKEVGRFLRSKVSDLSVSQICRILRAHAAVGCHEAELYHPIYERLCSVANKSSLAQLSDILHSVSLVESSTFDCLNIAELCLNRYSLSLRETSVATNAPLLESRILSAMSRMRILHEKTLTKMIKRLGSLGQSFSADSIVSINNHLVSLDCRPEQLIPISPSAKTSVVPVPTVFGCTNIHERKIALQAILSGEISDRKAYRSRVALVTEALMHNDRFLDDMSLEELEKLRTIALHQLDSFREKSPSFFDYKGISLERHSVAGIFSINTARVLSKQERAGRVIRKR